MTTDPNLPDPARARRESQALAEERLANAPAKLREAAEARLLNVARGCHDYGGGYRGDDDITQAQASAFHHGIQTVINALEAALRHDPHDLQTKVLEAVGSSAPPADAPPRPEDAGVIHKWGMCPLCHCSQTLPVDCQTCTCTCHTLDREGKPSPLVVRTPPRPAPSPEPEADSTYEFFDGPAPSPDEAEACPRCGSPRNYGLGCASPFHNAFDADEVGDEVENPAPREAERKEGDAKSNREPQVSVHSGLDPAPGSNTPGAQPLERAVEFRWGALVRQLRADLARRQKEYRLLSDHSEAMEADLAALKAEAHIIALGILTEVDVINSGDDSSLDGIEESAKHLERLTSADKGGKK